MPSRPSLARAAKAMAGQVLAHHFGRPARRLSAKGGGLTNFVFEADHPGGTFVVRIGREPGKLNAYLKEQWAIGRAAKAGVPVPEVLEVGNAAIGHPYMIARRVAGVPATAHPRREAIVREMGRLLAAVHSVRTDGFGATFDWSANRLSRNASWGEFLDREVDAAGRIATLKRLRMLPAKTAAALESAVRAQRRNRRPAHLAHGDMRLKNVVVDASGAVQAVLDWEDCISTAGPAWDLSIALHDLSIDAKQAFLDGYGMSARAYEAHAAAVKAFNLLNYAPPLAEIARREGRGALEPYRTRLRGALDLYVL